MAVTTCLEQQFTVSAGKFFHLVIAPLDARPTYVDGEITITQDDAVEILTCSITATQDVAQEQQTIEATQNPTSIHVRIGGLYYSSSIQRAGGGTRMRIDVKIQVPTECISIIIGSELLPIRWLTDASVQNVISLESISSPIELKNVRCRRLTLTTRDGDITIDDGHRIEVDVFGIQTHSGTIRAHSVSFACEQGKIVNETGKNELDGAAVGEIAMIKGGQRHINFPPFACGRPQGEGKKDQ